MYSIPLALLASALAAAVYYGARAMEALWWRPRRLERQLRRQGIEGTPYSFFYGDTREELQAIRKAWSSPMELNHKIVPHVFPFTHQMVQRYGKICFKWSGATPVLIAWDGTLMRDALSDKSGIIGKPPRNPAVKLLSRGVSSLVGEEWSKRRRLISPAFHLEKLKGMTPAFLTSCTDMIKRWEKLVGEQGHCELDVWTEFQILTGDVISRTAFGSSFAKGKRIFELQKEQGVLVIEASRTPYIPGFRFLPTTKNRRRVSLDREMRVRLRELIKKKKDSMKNGESGGDDLLGLLLHSGELSEQEVIEECKLFYIAGQETTSVTLTWALVLLSMNPIWQQRARDEILEIGGNSIPDFESINHLKTVTMILYEVLRLYPPLISQHRQTQKLTRLGDKMIPAGVHLELPTVLIHHDPELWGENAEEFNPDRFSEGISKASKGPNAFFPFGWGPRICLGQSFAMIEAKIALAMILKDFSFELSPSYAHAPYTVITLQPQRGAHIIIRKL